MTPYAILAEAAKSHPSKSLLAVWHEFACWEQARAYADDPNATSKQDIAWVCQLYDLAAQLDDLPCNTRNCWDALEAAAAAFARLDHEPELCEAVRRWREYRLEAEADEHESTSDAMQ